MTGILVTRFKMGQINVEDLAEMAVGRVQGREVLGCEKGSGGGERFSLIPTIMPPHYEKK